MLIVIIVSVSVTRDAQFFHFLLLRLTFLIPLSHQNLRSPTSGNKHDRIKTLTQSAELFQLIRDPLLF